MVARFPDAVQLGVGKASAAASIALALASWVDDKPDVVLLFGVCGAYPGRLAVGDLCLVERDELADEGKITDQGFEHLDSMGLGTRGPFFADRALTARAAQVLGINPVRGATVSTCSGTEVSSDIMARRAGAQVETMEGAAVALVCQRMGVPWVQLRAVSNHTGPEGKWHLELATDRVQKAALTLLDGSWA